MDRELMRTPHPRLRAVCAGCGITFRQMRPWHRACKVCFAWHAAAVYRAIVARYMTQVRP